MSVPDFPNLWMIEGPTGPVGNLSLITISEYQIEYLIRCLDEMKRRGLEAIEGIRGALVRLIAVECCFHTKLGWREQRWVRHAYGTFDDDVLGILRVGVDLDPVRVCEPARTRSPILTVAQHAERKDVG